MDPTNDSDGFSVTIDQFANLELLAGYLLCTDMKQLVEELTSQQHETNQVQPRSKKSFWQSTTQRLRSRKQKAELPLTMPEE